MRSTVSSVSTTGSRALQTRWVIRRGRLGARVSPATGPAAGRIAVGVLSTVSLAVAAEEITRHRPQPTQPTTASLPTRLLSVLLLLPAMRAAAATTAHELLCHSAETRATLTLPAGGAMPTAAT